MQLAINAVEVDARIALLVDPDTASIKRQAGGSSDKLPFLVSTEIEVR